MPVQPIPSFSADKPSNNTFLQDGFTLSDEYYRPRFEPNSDANISVNVVGNTNLQNITKPFFSTNTRRVFYEVKDGLHLEFESTTAGHHSLFVEERLGGATKSLLFIYDEDVYFLTNDNRLYVASGTTRSQPTLVETNLSEVIRGHNLPDTEPTNVEVFQNRLFISYGNRIIWSDTNNIREFRPEYIPTAADVANNPDVDNITEPVPTNAGTEQFQKGGDIIDMVVDADFMYLFFQRQVVLQRATEVDLQFHFIDFLEQVTYHGGAISTRNGVYFYANNAYYRLRGEELTKISEPIHVLLTNLRGQHSISSIVYNDNVYSVVSDTGLLTVYNLNYGTIDSRLTDYFFLGFLRDPVRSIGSLTLKIGAYTNTIGSFVTNEDTFPVAFIKPEGNTEIDSHTLELLPTNIIRFNLGKNDATKAMHILTMSMPEIRSDEFTVRIKEDNETRWSNPITADRFGVVRVHKKFHSPDIELSVPRNISISLINVDYSIVNR